VWKELRGLFGVVELPLEVGYVCAQAGQALPGRLLPDEVGDQQLEQGLALQRCEGDRGARVVLERTQPLVRS
jgi:hypothetical protein